MKHFFLSLFFLFLSTGLSFISQAPDTHALCWSDWGIGDCGNPAEIPFCQNGECTLENGSLVAETAVGDLLTRESITDFVTRIVLYFMSFVSIIAVVYVIYAGFQLMISGGDEEKAKKTRKIITYVIAGIIIMWVAYWIVRVIIDALL
jgi:hypothetical protein